MQLPNCKADVVHIRPTKGEKIMNVTRYFESMSTPNDTMFVEIDDRLRYTRRGSDWAKFREDLVQVLEQTVSTELSEAFAAATEEWLTAPELS